MQLRVARLCLDCEEVHAAPECPVCTSETFVYLTRWVPADERRRVARPTNATRPKQQPPPANGAQWARRGAFGLTALALGRWLWQSTRPVEWTEPAAGPTNPDDESR